MEKINEKQLTINAKMIKALETQLKYLNSQAMEIDRMNKTMSTLTNTVAAQGISIMEMQKVLDDNGLSE